MACCFQRVILLIVLFLFSSVDAFITPYPCIDTSNSPIEKSLPWKKTTNSLLPPAVLSKTRRNQRKEISFLRGSVGGTCLNSNSYILTRIVFLRALAFVYTVAFMVGKNQNKALIGDNGITPARNILNAAEKWGSLKRQSRDEWLNSTTSKGSIALLTDENEGRNKSMFIQSLVRRIRNSSLISKLGMSINRNPLYQYWRERLYDRNDGMGRPVTTLLWLARDRNKLNPWLDGISNCGICLSLLVLVLGFANVPIMLGLWLCQRSLMAVGGPWYGYGWEPQLAEVGFHALFLVPLLRMDRLASPPSAIVVYSFRWMLFRIMMGAGLIKIKSGDPKWKLKNLTTMDYFYETQPVPNPLTRFFHFMPRYWHKFEVLTNHYVELIAPWLLLVPITSLRRIGGIIQIAFQAVLITSGNLSFLNWLTIVPAIMCLDDDYLKRLFPISFRNKVLEASSIFPLSPARQIVSLGFGLLIFWLSIPVVKNLLSKRQLMNASFDPFRLVNSYGAFGTVDEERVELIVSAAHDIDGPWREYQFKVKPGDVMRRPRWISPYHYRLDWQMWIASALRNIDRSPWIYAFLLKVLEQDPDVLDLLETDPFHGEQAGPKYIKIDKYRYKFHKPERWRKGDNMQPYWDRELIGRVFPTQGIASKAILEDYC